MPAWLCLSCYTYSFSSPKRQPPPAACCTPVRRSAFMRDETLCAAALKPGSVTTLPRAWSRASAGHRHALNSSDSAGWSNDPAQLNDRQSHWHGKAAQSDMASLDHTMVAFCCLNVNHAPPTPLTVFDSSAIYIISSVLSIISQQQQLPPCYATHKRPHTAGPLHACCSVVPTPFTGVSSHLPTHRL